MSHALSSTAASFGPKSLLRSWRLVLGLTALGILAGTALALALPAKQTATAALYLGQTTGASGKAVAGPDANAKAALQLLSSQVVLAEAARATGMGATAEELRRGLSTGVSSQAASSGANANVLVISVTDQRRARAAKAANELAAALSRRISGRADEKVAILEQELTSAKRRLSASRARALQAEEALTTISAGGGASGAKVASASPYLAIVAATANEQRISSRPFGDARWSLSSRSRSNVLAYFARPLPLAHQDSRLSRATSLPAPQLGSSPASPRL